MSPATAMQWEVGALIEAAEKVVNLKPELEKRIRF